MKKTVFLILVVLLPVNAWGAMRPLVRATLSPVPLPTPPPLELSLPDPALLERRRLEIKHLRLENQKNLELKIKSLAKQLKTLREPQSPDNDINQLKLNGRN